MYVAALSVKNLTPLTKILRCAMSGAASKVEESVAIFFSFHCTIANCDRLIDMLENSPSDNKVIDDVSIHRSKYRDSKMFCDQILKI